MFVECLSLLLLLVVKVALLAIVEMGTAPPIVPGYGLLCAKDSIYSPPYILG